MPDPRALKIMALIMASYFAVLSLGYILPGEAGLPFLMVGMPLLVSVYIFDMMGLPGLLENDGHCGWGWCEPTLFGWFLATVFWLFMIYILTRMIIKIKYK